MISIGDIDAVRIMGVLLLWTTFRLKDGICVLATSRIPHFDISPGLHSSMLFSISLLLHESQERSHNRSVSHCYLSLWFGPLQALLPSRRDYKFRQSFEGYWPNGILLHQWKLA